MAQRKAKKSAGKKTTTKSDAAGDRTRLSADALPRRTLEQVIRVAKVIYDTYAGKAASLEDIARALDLNAGSANTKYLVWSAAAYGLLARDDTGYALGEVGRKVLAPTFDGEDAEAKIKAILTPSVASKFYTDYNEHPIPFGELLPNVLEHKYGVPRDRLGEAVEVLVENARFAGILVVDPVNGQQRISLASSPIQVPPTDNPPLTDTTIGTSQVAWETTCFYITPIGAEASETRKHSDMLLRHLVEPICKEHGLTVIRADRIERSGLITKQVFEHLVRARLCVTDLSFNNPNVFYEMGVRHMTKLPCIQLIRKGDGIPFDVAQGRTIIIDTADVYSIMDRIESAGRELREHIRHILSADYKPGEDNPVEVYMPGIKVSLPK